MRSFKVYCIYDSVAEDFGDIFTAVNDAVAMRSFKRMVAQNKIPASDLTLYRLGDYDAVEGYITSYERVMVRDVSEEDIENG